MPVFEYRCADCDAMFEVLVRRDDGVTCLHCGSQNLDKLISAAVVLSGQTNRQAGHTCCGREERCEMPPCSVGDDCRRG